MGLIHEPITLVNAGDVIAVRRGYMKDQDIRQVDVNAMVDTGSEMLIINEAMRLRLGLEIAGRQPVSLANGLTQTCHISEPIEVHWNSRSTITNAAVLDDAPDVLLGAIPLEGLNVIVDPAAQQLVGKYGDKIMFRV